MAKKKDAAIKLPSNPDATEHYATDEATARAFADQEGVEWDTVGKNGKNATIDKVGVAYVVRTGQPTSDDVVSTSTRRAATNADADADFKPTDFVSGPNAQSLDSDSAAQK